MRGLAELSSRAEDCVVLGNGQGDMPCYLHIYIGDMSRTVDYIHMHHTHFH